MSTKVAKVKLDPRAALAEHQASATAAASDRFARATEITRVQPTGLAPVLESPAPAPLAAPEGQGRAGAVVNRVQSFDISSCTPGSIVRVPLHMIDTNPLSPRHNYSAELVDKIAKTLPNGQDDAAHGYVHEGRIRLIDGGTRFRAAQVTGAGYLDVKIEEAPRSMLDLYSRARELNETRSDTTPLDFALSLKALLEQKAVANFKELVERVKGPDGTSKLTDATASTYLRIAKLPAKIQRAMGEAEETRTVTALYAVSELFPDDLDETVQAERIEMALDVVEEIKRRKLNKHQIVALVKAKLAGPKTRERSTMHQIDIGGHKGQIKTFARKGKIDLSLSGVSEDRLGQLRDRLEQTLKDFFAGA